MIVDLAEVPSGSTRARGPSVPGPPTAGAGAGLRPTPAPGRRWSSSACSPSTVQAETRSASDVQALLSRPPRSRTQSKRPALDATLYQPRTMVHKIAASGIASPEAHGVDRVSTLSRARRLASARCCQVSSTNPATVPCAGIDTAVPDHGHWTGEQCRPASHLRHRPQCRGPGGRHRPAPRGRRRDHPSAPRVRHRWPAHAGAGHRGLAASRHRDHNSEDNQLTLRIDPGGDLEAALAVLCPQGYDHTSSAPPDRIGDSHRWWAQQQQQQREMSTRRPARVTPAVEREPVSSTTTQAVCCGQGGAWAPSAGRPVVIGCMLCPRSPTYWRKPTGPTDSRTRPSGRWCPFRI
jgi:hypothetical protein